MTRIIMTYGAVAIIFICMWYPGFMLSRNVIKAVRDDNPTLGETILAIIPGFNMVNPRKEFYGSAKLVWAVNILLIVAVIQKLVFYYFFDTAIVAAIFSTYIFYAVCVIYWVVNGYVIQDIGACSQCGILSRVLAFIFPPLSQYLIGRNCVATIRYMMANMQTAE